MYSYILDILLFIVLSFYFCRAVFIWEFSFPLLLSFTNYTFIYLSGFDKRYLQKILATVSFEACSLLDHFLFLNDLFSTKIPLKATVDKKNMCLICCLHLPHPPPAALPYLSFPIILSLS